MAARSAAGTGSAGLAETRGSSSQQQDTRAARKHYQHAEDPAWDLLLVANAKGVIAVRANERGRYACDLDHKAGAARTFTAYQTGGHYSSLLLA